MLLFTRRMCGKANISYVCRKKNWTVLLILNYYYRAQRLPNTFFGITTIAWLTTTRPGEEFPLKLHQDLQELSPDLPFKIRTMLIQEIIRVQLPILNQLQSMFLFLKVSDYVNYVTKSGKTQWIPCKYVYCKGSIIVKTALACRITPNILLPSCKIKLLMN